jgi:hypothetical protein
MSDRLLARCIVAPRLATIQARYHYQYQANTTRHRLVLSVITLGRHGINGGATGCRLARIIQDGSSRNR